MQRLAFQILRWIAFWGIMIVPSVATGIFVAWWIGVLTVIPMLVVGLCVDHLICRGELNFTKLIVERGVSTSGKIISVTQTGRCDSAVLYRTAILYFDDFDNERVGYGYPNIDYPHPCSPIQYVEVGNRVPVFYLPKFPFFYVVDNSEEFAPNPNRPPNWPVLS